MPVPRPAWQIAKPPNIDRAADADPRRARRDSAVGSRSRPYAAAPASARAAKPLAEDARPAPVGTELRVSTAAGSVRPANSRTRSRNATTRCRCSPSAGEPSSTTLSACTPGSGRTVVVVGKTSKVIDRLSTYGIMSRSSRLPQYLISAMFGWATAVAPRSRTFSAGPPGSTWWSMGMTRESPRRYDPGPDGAGFVQAVRDGFRLVGISGQRDHAAAQPATGDLCAQAAGRERGLDQLVDQVRADPDVLEQPVVLGQPPAEVAQLAVGEIAHGRVRQGRHPPHERVVRLRVALELAPQQFDRLFGAAADTAVRDDEQPVDVELRARVVRAGRRLRGAWGAHDRPCEGQFPGGAATEEQERRRTGGEGVDTARTAVRHLL